MAVKEEEDSSGSDENIGNSEAEDDSEAEESEQEHSAEDEEEEEEEEEAAVTVKKNVDAVVKSDVNKLDKAGLNEFLVKLRRPITQAKVHVIHKLTKDIAMLRRKKTKSEADKSKNERKVARFVQEVQVLRKEKKDAMARWVVANDVTLEQVTKEETASQKIDLRLRAMARVAEHKAVLTLLKEFRVKYPRWKSRVPKLLRSLGKNRKKVDPNLEPLGVKGLKSVKKSKSEEDETNQGESDLDGDDEEDSVKPTTKAKKNEVKNFVKAPKDKERIDKSQSSPLQKVAKREKNSQMVVKVLDLKGGIKEPLPIGETQKVKGIASAKPQKLETKKSSFFVGGESDEDNSEGGESEEDEEEEGNHQSWQMSKGSQNAFTSNRSGGNKFVPKGDKSQGGQRQADREPKLEEHLHPSWQAKKRAPPAMAQYQGKKTKFGADGDAVAPKSQAPKSQEPVHPSWAAKQSLKTSIQSFKGKKMVFDD